MISYKFILFFIMLLAMSILYEKIKKEENKNTSKYYFEMVDKYLLTQESINKNNKPCLWIHLHNDNIVIPSTNQRKWENFYSRNSKEINQPYLYLCIKKIIDNCKNDFNICLIDDDSFHNIIPNWNLNLSNMSSPLKFNIRTLALTKILHIYGGVIIPPYFIAFKSLKKLYYNNLRDFDFAVGDILDRTINNSNIHQSLIPSTKIMMGKANSNMILEFIKHQEILYSKDFTFEFEFLGKNNKWLEDEYNNDRINIIDGKLIGSRDKDDKVIIVDNLFEEKYIEFHEDIYGLYIPWDEIILRYNFSWFPKLEFNEIYQSNILLSKLLIIN